MSIYDFFFIYESESLLFGLQYSVFLDSILYAKGRYTVHKGSVHRTQKPSKIKFYI